MVRLTVPMIFAIISMMLLGVVDTFFISLLGTAQLAAASFVMPIYMMTISLSLGIGMGLGSITSRLIGEDRHDEAARYITDAQIFAALFAIIVAVLLYLFINPIFMTMGAKPDVMPFIRGYMHIVLFGTPMLMLTVIGNNTFRAIGNVKASAILSALLSLLNLVLDPLFIFGIGPFPELGMRGAALATVISALVSWISSFYVLGFREKLFDFTKPDLEHLIPNWKKLTGIAIPAMGANIMTPFAAAIMTAIISRFGAEAVAGFGVGARIESMSLLVVFALSSTLPMFIGQNIGAARNDRAYLALMGCLRFTLMFQAGVYVILLISAPVIAGCFSDNAEVINVIKTYLYILPLTYGAHGVVILIMVSLNVLHRPRTALLITIIRLGFLYLPLAFAGSLIWGVTGLFAGAACGNVIAGTIAYQIIKRVCQEQGIRYQEVKVIAPQEI